MSEFKAFPKITRLYEQDVCVTEKIDGTNGLIYVDANGSVRAGSRSRWVTPEADNYGFAKWVEDNKEELKLLGEGYHYGEWWGNGIQRKYDMDKKVFSLFNVWRWGDDTVRPKCCDVVPTLYLGPITPEIVDEYSYPAEVSLAAQKYGVEFFNPEGTMMYFTKAGVYFKVPNAKGMKG